MNTLNLLGPALLLCAVCLVIFAQFSDQLPEPRHALLIAASLLVATSLFIRLAWGIGIRLIAARARREADKHSVQAADHHDSSKEGERDRNPVK